MRKAGCPPGLREVFHLERLHVAMEAPGCHARPHPRRVVVTAALAAHVDRLDLPAEPGVSPRAVRAMLRIMARIANDAGEFRYGLRGSKLAALTDYSLSVIRRAQRYLVEHGYLERVKSGGGRASTRWRIPIHKLRPDHEQRPSSDAAPTHQPDRDDTAQSHTPWSFLRRNHPANSRRPSPAPPPPTSQTLPVCKEHGSSAGLLPTGLPRCPSCRQRVLRR